MPDKLQTTALDTLAYVKGFRKPIPLDFVARQVARAIFESRETLPVEKLTQGDLEHRVKQTIAGMVESGIFQQDGNNYISVTTPQQAKAR